MPHIDYIKRKDIDIQKWDACIDAAPNGLIYAYSFYLDAMCDNWDALVLGDYEAVMPLPWRKKWGIKYVYTPYFVPMLGIFYKEKKAGHNHAFFAALASHFRYCNLDTNLPVEQTLQKHWHQVARTNLIISQPVAKYSRLAKRKLATANEHKLTIEANVSAEKIIKMYQQIYQKAHREIPAKSYEQLINACAKAPASSIFTWAAHLQHQPFAGFYLVLTDKKNFYSLLGGSTLIGKEAGAFYALTDAAIQTAMQHRKAFRFEGSDIPGIAFFDQQFGAQPFVYTQWRMNRLPWLMRMFKK